MDICIIICTYNRAPVLRDTLESALAMHYPEGVQSEVLIVDNNSDDDTPAVSREFCTRVPGLFRYLREPRQGLSIARNSGIRASRAEFIAFADDDVYFDKGWLPEVLKAFCETGAMCIGGRSIPHFDGGEPGWISPELLPIYGSTNSGDRVKRMIYPEFPYGLNMAFRRTVFDAVGPFNETLGRMRNSLMSSEEMELFHRIDRRQLPVFYTPHALIHHRIAASRARKGWVLRRFYYQGISDAAFRQIVAPEGAFRLLRRFGGGLRHLIRLSCEMLGALLTGRADERERLRRLAWICRIWGATGRTFDEMFRVTMRGRVTA